MVTALPSPEQCEAMDDTAGLRRPVDPNASCGTGTPFTESAGTRHCMTCNKWRPQAGGRKHPRTGFFECSCCKPQVVAA